MNESVALSAGLGNILMVVHSYYEDDTRVRREAEALTRAGYSVDIVALRKPGQYREEELSGVSVRRINVGRSESRGKLSYIFEYLNFFIRSFLVCSKKSLFRKYKFFFAHNMPNFLVFCGLVPRLRGAEVVLDMHDSMPELFSTIYGIRSGFLKGVLYIEERLSCAFSNRLITANRYIEKVLTERTGKNFFVLHNTPDTEILPADDIRERVKTSTENIVLLHHGNIHKRYGLDRVLPIMSSLAPKNVQLEVHGRGPWYSEVQNKAKELGVQDYCIFGGGFKPEDAQNFLSKADVGLVLNYSDPLADLLLPVKMLEYIASGIPVVCPRTKGIELYFPKDSVYYFESDQELKEILMEVVSNLQEAKERAMLAKQIYKDISWKVEEQRFVAFLQSA